MKQPVVFVKFSVNESDEETKRRTAEHKKALEEWRRHHGKMDTE